MATIDDVAREAGVSRGTVSNVLNHPELVSSGATSKVLMAIDALGYVPSNSARILGGARPRSIGLLVHDVGNPFFAEMAIGVEDRALAAGYVIMLNSTRASDERQRRAVTAMLAQEIPGVLLSPAASGTADLDILRQHDVKVVLLDHPGTSDTCSTSVDDVRGGTIATAHLLGNGRSRFAFVGGPKRTRQHGDRLTGMKSTVRAAGLGIRAHVTVVPTALDTIAAGLDAGARVLDAGRPLPDGIVCGNDLLAIGVIEALRHGGVQVPDQINVVGYDDIELAALVATPITSIRQPMYELGQAATEMLLSELLEPEHVHSQRTFHPELVVRSSTGG